jgi:hypothetical protein
LIFGGIASLVSIGFIGAYLSFGQARALGQVRIASKPSGAAILADGDQRLGTTPATLSLRKGTHTLRIAKDGYATLEASVEVEIGKEIPLNLTLHQTPQ